MNVMKVELKQRSLLVFQNYKDLLYYNIIIESYTGKIFVSVKCIGFLCNWVAG